MMRPEGALKFMLNIQLGEPRRAQVRLWRDGQIPHPQFLSVAIPQHLILEDTVDD